MKAVFQFAIPYPKEDLRKPWDNVVLRKEFKLDVMPQVRSSVKIPLVSLNLGVEEVYFDLSCGDEAVLMVLLGHLPAADSREAAGDSAEHYKQEGWACIWE